MRCIHPISIKKSRLSGKQFDELSKKINLSHPNLISSNNRRNFLLHIHLVPRVIVISATYSKSQCRITGRKRMVPFIGHAL